MSSSETSSRKRDAETIHVAGGPKTTRAKRLRVSVACVECRRKKERCDGSQPVCGSCTSQGRNCSYVQRPKKRGLVTGYVRGLEILLGLIFHSLEGCEHSVVAILKGESAIESPSSGEEETASTVNVLVDAWRTSSSWKELERILSEVESGEDEDLTARDLHDRLDEALKKSLSIKKDASASGILCPISPPDSLGVLLDHGSTSDVVGSSPQGDGRISTNETRVFPSLPLSAGIPPGGLSNLWQDWSQLLDIYFANTNCWMPIVLRNDAFRAAYTASDESNSSNANELPLGDKACLLSMLAYARYTQCIAIRKNGSRPDLQGHFADLFAQASQLITTYESRRDIGDIQAMLIITLLHYAQGNLRLAWSSVGRAVYHAVELGLLKSGVTQSPPLDDRSKRVILSCFVLETLLSARLYRRPHLQTSDVRSVGLLDADGIEEWEPWRPTVLSSPGSACNSHQPSHQPAKILSTFNLLVQTSTILNDKLQCRTNETEKKAPQEYLDILHLIQSQNHLDSHVAQSEAHNTSPQAINLMLAALASFPYQVSTGIDVERTNSSCSSNITLDLHRSLARVIDIVNQQGAVTLSPLADVYLHIVESRNSNATLLFSREALDSIKSMREIRTIYNETWRDNTLDSYNAGQATARNQAAPIIVTSYPAGVVEQALETQSVSRNQSTMDDAVHGVDIYATRAQGASIPPQQEGSSCSRRAPPNDARHTNDSWSPLTAPLTQMTGPSDLFSSLVSLEDDERPVLSQEFVGNLGMLGDISMDPVEFQSLFTG